MSFPEFSEYFRGEARRCLMRALQAALEEDGPDLTTDGIFSTGDRVRAVITAKQRAVMAGLPVIPLVMDLCEVRPGEPPYSWQAAVREGEELAPGTVAARLTGSAHRILRAERVILNFICRLSGIASLTRVYADALKGTGVRLLDTRKTAPGLRYPEKYAVLAGGGCNHRRNLSEMLMIKDNHIDAAGSISRAVRMLRERYNPCPPIEVECRTCAEVKEAAACNVDRIMLDNMSSEMRDKALSLVPCGIETEVSGDISLEDIRSPAFFGMRRPDFVSVGRITHSAPVADFSLRIVREGTA